VSGSRTIGLFVSQRLEQRRLPHPPAPDQQQAHLMHRLLPLDDARKVKVEDRPRVGGRVAYADLVAVRTEDLGKNRKRGVVMQEQRLQRLELSELARQ
ncbi:MAG TPA: hypothetical protein VK509_00405, partial [Polyangiales bacterium]|nr:hypothetical protein [Polyangiales bacterium]